MGDIPQIQTKTNAQSSSTPQYLRLFATQQEHGHPTKNTTEWFNRRNARCYDSSFKQKENTRKTEKQDIGANEEIEEIDVNDMCSTDDEGAQKLTMTWTVTFRLKTMLMKNLIPHQPKKKTGLKTEREALKMPQERWKAHKLDAGTRLTKNEMEIGIENRHFTKRQMAEKGCWLEPWIEHKIQDQQSDRETKKQMGRWH